MCAQNGLRSRKPSSSDLANQRSTRQPSNQGAGGGKPSNRLGGGYSAIFFRSSRSGGGASVNDSRISVVVM